MTTKKTTQITWILDRDIQKLLEYSHNRSLYSSNSITLFIWYDYVSDAFCVTSQLKLVSWGYYSCHSLSLRLCMHVVLGRCKMITTCNFQVDLVDRREEIEEGFGVALSEEYPAIVIDKQIKFSSVGEQRTIIITQPLQQKSKFGTYKITFLYSNQNVFFHIHVNAQITVDFKSCLQWLVYPCVIMLTTWVWSWFHVWPVAF